MVKSKSVTNPKAKINYLKVGMMDKNVSSVAVSCICILFLNLAFRQGNHFEPIVLFYFKYFLGTTMIQNQKQNLKL